MENKNGSKLLGRRDTIHLLGVGLAATGLFGLAACKQDNGAPQGGGSPSPSPVATTPPAATAPADTAAANGAAAGTCDSPIEAASKTSRKVMQYKNPAAIPEKHCSACSQFIEAKYGDCGGCKLFTGPVKSARRMFELRAEGRRCPRILGVISHLVGRLWGGGRPRRVCVGT